MFRVEIELELFYYDLKLGQKRSINKFNKLLGSMSIHSAQRSQNPNEDNSHITNPTPSLQAHSAQLQHPSIHPEHREWVAAFIDGQYYLTDPESMKRLKDMETEIAEEKLKLAKLQNENHSVNNSFLSLQEDKAEKQSHKSFCNTQFNENRQIHKQQKVKNELQKEQDKYRQKIKRMEKERNQMKKVIAPSQKVMKEKESQHKQPSKKPSEKQQPENQESTLKEPSKKGSIRPSQKEAVQAKQPGQIQKSRKSGSRSIRPSSKDKSYKKSQIEQSIKDNIEMQVQSAHQDKVLLLEGSSLEPINKEPESSVKKSINSKVLQETPCQKEESVKPSQKQSKQPSEKKSSIQPSQKISVQPSEKRSVHPSNKEPEATLKGEAPQKQKSELKSSKIYSRKSSLKEDKLNNEQSVKEKSDYEAKVYAVGSVHSSKMQPQTEKKPYRIDEKSQKESAAHREPSQQQSERPIQSRVQSRREEDTKSKKTSQLNEQIKSRKSSVHKEEEVKSRHSNIILFDETKSRKSQAKSKVQDKSRSIKSKEMSQKQQSQKDQLKSKKSSIRQSQHEETKSKHTDKAQSRAIEQSSKERSVREPSHKNQDNRSAKQSSVAAPTPYESRTAHEQSRLHNKNETKIDKSIQYSRITDPNQQSRANEIKFKNISQKNNSFIQHHEQSMGQSSHLKLQCLNNQLNQQPVQTLETPSQQTINMKKKKSNSIKDNQSQKKSRSFIIHSRNGSVKERSQKQYDRNRNKLSEEKSRVQHQSPSNHTESVTKEEIFKLHQQIAFLRDKLQEVQERQKQMQKLEATVSKINRNQSEIQVNDIVAEVPTTPPANQIEESIQLKHHRKLHLTSSIIQVDTLQDMRKKNEKETELQEKDRLKGEISRLKKIIRQMQIEKIKSIDHENQMLGDSNLIKKQVKNQSHRQSRVQKESIQQMPTQKKFWNKSRVQDVGRIIKNSQIDQKFEMSPRRRSQQLKHMGYQDQVIMEPEDLPYESAKKRVSKVNNMAKHSSLIDKLHDKDKDFHHFLESSRALVEEGHKRQPTQHINQTSMPSSLHQFTKVGVSQHSSHQEPANKINYSRMVEEFKKNNPEQDEILPEIHLRDIKIADIPNTPTPDLNQDDLLSLAKKTYNSFGIDVDQEDKQLCVKKYKNCVVFSITNNTSECILWHFSGKFYMGGWKAGQPGEGEKHGQGLQIIPEKYVYQGQFLNGKKNGTGILKLVNGNIYDGQWIDGLKNGRGVYLDAATRVLYSGEWKEGKKDGQGYLKLSQKEYYYGTFNKSIKEGFGTQMFVNGDKYKGQYRNGKFHGKGKYIWANGSCYEGQFIEGVRQGQGSWKSAKNNGDIYIGTYQSDKKNGYGRYVWANGCMYEGGFSNDVKHGKGRLTYQDGKQVKGVWQEGNLIKTESDAKPPGDHQQKPLRRSLKLNSFGGYPSNHRF